MTIKLHSFFKSSVLIPFPSYRVNVRLFSSKITPNITEIWEPAPHMKTVADKKGNIVRKFKGSVWESVIGLEVHAQINAQSKMFSSAPNKFNSPVNTCVSYFDASIPGTLPVLNRRCVEAGIMTSLALGSHLNLVSHFDRKHYFYADLPAGYQITQQRCPLAVGGSLSFPVLGLQEELGLPFYTGHTEIVQLQLEQDSGKSLHDEDRSLIDLNRAGTGLMEIVFGPDLKHGEEASALVRELILLLSTLDTCKARMERGELRVDANVSVRRLGGELGTRTEVKNLNSVRSVGRAIEFEVWRQIEMLENSGIVENETKSFDWSTRRTVSMRDKEAKQDYRFMPEPNLPPLRLHDSSLAINTNVHSIDIAPIRTSIPELPREMRDKLKTDYDLTDDISVQLVEYPILLTYFKKCMNHQPDNVKEVLTLILSTLRDHLENGLCLTPQQLVEVSNLRQRKMINYGGMTKVLGMILEGDRREPEDIIKVYDLYVVNDMKVIEEFVKDKLVENKELVAKYRNSKNEKKRLRAWKSLLTAINKDRNVEKLDMEMFSQIFKSMLDS